MANVENTSGKPKKKDINAYLKRARLRRLWTIGIAAEKVGVSETTYIRWEQGKQDPHLVNLQALCDAFGLTSRELGYTTLLVNGDVRVQRIESQTGPRRMESEIISPRRVGSETIPRSGAGVLPADEVSPDIEVLLRQREALEQTRMEHAVMRSQLEARLRRINSDEAQIVSQLEQNRVMESRARRKLSDDLEIEIVKQMPDGQWVKKKM